MTYKSFSICKLNEKSLDNSKTSYAVKMRKKLDLKNKKKNSISKYSSTDFSPKTKKKIEKKSINTEGKILKISKIF